MCWAFVVTSTQNHWIIHLFNIIEILNKYLFDDFNSMLLSSLDVLVESSHNLNLQKLKLYVNTEAQ